MIDAAYSGHFRKHTGIDNLVADTLLAGNQKTSIDLLASPVGAGI